jgi:hypothetical protein
VTVTVTSTRSILFRKPEPVSKGSTGQPPEPLPYVKRASEHCIIPVSDTCIAIPDWVPQLPEYDHAVKAGVLTPC